jgi:predicted nucleotidyltransferase
MTTFDRRLGGMIARQPYPLLFVTVSGAHLYGFASSDSDYDLRGVHLLPGRQVLGLDVRDETIEKSVVDEGLEIDLVTHDLRKFMGLLLKKNGYVLEQLLSPLVLHTTEAHRELAELSKGCITRHHAHHYLGFAQTQWGLFEKKSPPRAKPLLYVYRVLLTGIHLMRTGVVEANLVRLNEEYRLPYVPELIARKAGGGEQSVLTGSDVEFHRGEYERLRGRLEAEHAASKLPEGASAREALSALLIRLRVENLG